MARAYAEAAARWKVTKPGPITVQNCIDFYIVHNDPCTLESTMERLFKHLGRLLGRQVVCKLRRRDIWEVLTANLPWPTARDCLAGLKTVLNYSAKPRKCWRVEIDTPAPIIDKWDNPLQGLKVNYGNSSRFGGEFGKASEPPVELVHDMTVGSDAAWAKAKEMRRSVS
jgi:hypothetical protein